MKTLWKMNLNKLVIIILFSTGSVFGQDIGITEVKILEGFKPVISKASKLNENATFADTIKKDRTQVYDILDVKLKSHYKIKPLSAAKVKDDKIPFLYGTEIGVGFGSAFETKVDVLYNSKRSKSFTYGIMASHFANKYSFAKNSNNEMFFYGKSISSSYVFFADLEYSRRTAFYQDPEINLIDKQFLRNRFAYTKFSITALSKQDNPQAISHRTHLFVSDLNEFSENQIHLSSNIKKVINDVSTSWYLKFDDYFNYYNDSDFEKKDVRFFAFSPSILIKENGFDVDLGADISLVSSESKMSFFPMIKIEKELVEGIILVNAGLRNIKHRHTLKKLSDKNPYIHSFGMNQSLIDNQAFVQDLKFSERKELYFSIRNVLSKGEIFESIATYSNVKNFAHFIRYDLPSYHRFQVNYLDLKEFHLKLNYDKRINELINLEITLDYFEWDKDVYNKSNYIVGFRVPFRLRDKLKVVSSLNYLSKRKVLNYYLLDDLDVSNTFSQDLSAQFFINLSFHYFYSKQLSAFLELNNITNTQKYFWDGYYQLGFNGLVGVNYSF